jgi:hypothetical protein
VWTVPEVRIAFAVKAYDRAGEQVLDKVYDSVGPRTPAGLRRGTM